MIKKIKNLVGLNFLHMGRIDRLPINKREVSIWNNQGKGIDCLGLLLLVNRSIGINLPDYVYERDWDKKCSFNVYLDGFNTFFNKVDFPEPYDSIMFKVRSQIPNHTGIYLGNDVFIQSSENVGVAINHLSGIYSKMVYGYYRVK